MRKSNIVLIGMPGSGKTTIGKRLSRTMKLNFFDCDEYIEQMEGKSLQQIINEQGVEAFKRIEESRIMELNLKNYVIAPGGSVVYSPKAIHHLQRSSILVYLNVPLRALESRLNNASTRGIIGLKTKTLHQLFDERRPLYVEHADVIVDCSGKSRAAIVEEIRQRVRNNLEPITNGTR